jgi:hypothetical protein
MTLGLTPGTSSAKALGDNDLVFDAWGRQKVIHDYSLFHGICTYDVPNRLWEELSVAADGTRTPLASTGTNAVSENGMLVVKSGTTANQGNACRSKRNPGYQPNRGHLFSTAIICPNPDAPGIRRWGLFTDDGGVYFELEGTGASHTLYAVRKSAGDVKTRIAVTLPGGFDVSKGNVYDIQYQWRGVGNYNFFANLQAVYIDSLLGSLSELSLQNPANPVTIEAITKGTTEIEVRLGCVDVTTEGGKHAMREFASVSTGDALLKSDSDGAAMLGLYIPRTLDYNGDTVVNTRDLVASKITSWTRDEAATQAWIARDNVATNLAALTWQNFPDSTTDYLIGGAGSVLNTAFQLDRANMQLLLTEWVDAEEKNIVINPTGATAPFSITPGDILIIVVKSFAGTDDNATTLYLAEEI